MPSVSMVDSLSGFLGQRARAMSDAHTYGWRYVLGDENVDTPDPEEGDQDVELLLPV